MPSASDILRENLPKILSIILASAIRQRNRFIRFIYILSTEHRRVCGERQMRVKTHANSEPDHSPKCDPLNFNENR